MIIVRFIGGLGNQMFQFAFYEQLRDEYAEVRADISEYEKLDIHNGYELKKVFNLNLDKASEEDLQSCKDLSFEVGNYFAKLRRLIFGKRDTHIHETEFENDLLEQGSDVYLSGYWQGEEYFFGVSEKVRKKFQFKLDSLSETNRDILQKINSRQSVSIHVRRGDYLENSHHHVCGLDYYKKSVRYIKERTRKPFFFVFSDDIGWAKNKFDFATNNFTFVENNSGNTSYIDMFLMKSCTHNIIANSSFSWWAAWLNSNNNKVVIAPKRWFKDKSEEDIVPARWIRF